MCLSGAAGSVRTEQIGNATLYLGNSLDVIPTLGPVDAVVSDPPYGIEGGSGGDAKAFKKGHYAMTGWEDSPAYIEEVVVPAIKLALASAKRGAITPGRRCAWFYPAPQDIGAFYLPASASHGKWGFGVCDPILYYGKDPRAGIGAVPSGTIVTEPAKVEGHPAAKPTSAMRWLVNKVAMPGELVLDPFMGSGSTGVACMEIDRRFIGIEREERYFDLACKRIDDSLRQGRLIA